MGKKARTDLLQKWLKDHQWTREKLARALDMSTVFTLNFVNGKNTDVRVSSLAKLHDITGIPYEELVAFCQLSTKNSQ